MPPLEPWMKYRAKQNLRSITMAHYYVESEQKRIKRLHTIKSVITSQHYNKVSQGIIRALPLGITLVY